MTNNVIGLNGVSLATPVERETPNYTLYADGTIRVTQRAMNIYCRDAHRLGIDIRQIRNEDTMRDLQIRSWKLRLQDMSQDSRVPAAQKEAFVEMLDMGTGALA